MSYDKAFTLPELIDLIGNDHFQTISEALERRRQAERTLERLSTVSPHDEVVNATRELKDAETTVSKIFMDLGIGIYALYRWEMHSNPKHSDTQQMPAVKP